MNCTATDATGLTSTGTFTVHVVDASAPEILGVDKEQERLTEGLAGGPGHHGLDWWDASPATMNCGHASGSYFPIGEATVTCTGTDGLARRPTASR